MFVHCDLPNIPVYVREDVLYDMDLTKANACVKCELIGVSSYPGHVPTFQILVNKESVFSYIPPHLVFGPRKIHNILELSDLVYFNCPDEYFSLNKFERLLGEVSVYFKAKKIWMAGEYLFTMDWYRGNALMHAICLANGQIAFMPSHKVSWGSRELPAYKKLHQEWKV